MANFMAGIISLAVSSVVLSGVLISTIKNANTSGFTSSETALWGTVSLVAIAGFIYGVLAVFGLA